MRFDNGIGRMDSAFNLGKRFMLGRIKGQANRSDRSNAVLS